MQTVEGGFWHGVWIEELEGMNLPHRYLAYPVDCSVASSALIKQDA
jgi:hypothetical protein